MRLKLHDDVEGKKSGETVDVAQDRGEWLVANGYASDTSDTSDKVNITGVPAEKDPTLAENREAPEDAPPGAVLDEVAPAPQGLGAQRASNVPELTNRGDATLEDVPGIVEKAEKGKETVEKRSAEVDQPAPEEVPDPAKRESLEADQPAE